MGMNMIHYKVEIKRLEKEISVAANDLLTQVNHFHDQVDLLTAALKYADVFNTNTKSIERLLKCFEGNK
jgi:nitrate reductase assembly molybdenum cofactor insertion protein NarJ